MMIHNFVIPSWRAWSHPSKHVRSAKQQATT